MRRCCQPRERQVSPGPGVVREGQTQLVIAYRFGWPNRAISDLLARLAPVPVKSPCQPPTPPSLIRAKRGSSPTKQGRLRLKT